MAGGRRYRAFESGWTSDHFYPMHGAAPGVPRLEGWITLTALAQATPRLRLGTRAWPVSPSTGTSAAGQFTRARDVLHRHCAELS